jgi:hypothetical protein
MNRGVLRAHGAFDERRMEVILMMVMTRELPVSPTAAEETKFD